MATAVERLVAGAGLLMVSWLGGERLPHWPALGYLVVFGSPLAFSAYLYLLGRVRPAAATRYAYVNPVVAVVLIGVPQWRRR